MSSLSGKAGLIVGVANKRSIAWAIAQAAANAGVRLAITYQGERLGENVRERVRGDRARVRRPRLRRPRRGVRAAGGAVEPIRADLARGIPHRARHQRL